MPPIRSRTTTVVSLVAAIALASAVLMRQDRAAAASDPAMREHQAGVAKRSAADIAHDVQILRDLKPLPKVHYSWALPDHLFRRDSNALLFEIVRITKAASLRGENCTKQYVDHAMKICRAVHTRHGVHPQLAINFSPWHRKFDKKALATDEGPSCAAELSHFRSRLSTIAKLVDRSNQEQRGQPVVVGAVLLDCERFRIKPKDRAYNAAITRKFNQIHDVAQAIFPNARIEWYGQGVRRSANKTGWSKFNHSTMEHKLGAFSCSLYSVPEIGYMRETFRRTLELAMQRGVSQVTPWVALGAGYRRAVDAFHRWDFDWNYDLVYSWLLGAELNQSWYGKRPKRYAPWNAAEIVILYPPPMDPRTPAWLPHFAAYVRGANGIKSLGPG